jgi:hypothetical protein
MAKPYTPALSATISTCSQPTVRMSSSNSSMALESAPRTEAMTSTPRCSTTTRAYSPAARTIA